MSFKFDLFSLLVLLGACQGLILSLYLFLSKKESIRGKNHLGFFMLVFAYNGFETFSWSSGINNPYINLFFECFHYAMSFGFGPSLYLYVKSLTRPEDTISRPVFDYYAPLVLRLSMRISIVIYALLWNNGIWFKAYTPGDLDYWDVITAEPLSVLVFCIYLAMAYKEFREFSKSRVTAPVSNQVQDEIINKWLRIFLRCMAVFAVIWTGTVLAPMLFNVEYGPHFYFIEVLLVFFIYWIAFVGYYRTKVIVVELQKTVSANSNSIPVEEMQTYAVLIENALEKDKLYRDPDLSVSKLAAHIQSSPKLISAVLNQYLNKGFSECINAYRIEEVKERLLDPQYSHLTISGIALESGFNSQATFQRAFKSSTGMSPKEYLASQTQKSA